MYISISRRSFVLTGLALTGLVSAGVVLVAMGADPASKAADGIIFAADAMVLPSERYLLSTPFNATVVKAPVFGSAHLPGADLPTDPMERMALVARWKNGDGDANAVAQVDFDPGAMDAIGTKRKRADLYDRYLIDYGFAGIDPSADNLPWRWEPDPAREAATKGALNWVTQNKADPKTLRDSLQNAATGSPLPDFAQQLKASVISTTPATAALADNDWHSIIDKVLVYSIRQQLKLNDTLVEFGPGGTANLPPNDGNWMKYSKSSRLEFYVGRTLEDDSFGDKNLAAFLNYWSTVTDKNLFSDTDIQFLSSLAFMNTPHPGGAVITKPDWKQAGQTLIADCKDAVAKLQKWRGVTFQLYVNRETGTQLRAIDPSLDDATLKNLTDAATSAVSMGQPDQQMLRPQSSQAAIAWLADQTRASWGYSGKTITVVEKMGDYGNGIVIGPKGLIHFVLWEYNRRDPIQLPEPIGGTIWRELQGNTAGDRTNFEKLPDKDPFGSLVWQTVLTLTPTVDGTSNNPSADTLYSAGRLVSIFGADLRGKLAEAAPAVRAYGKALEDQYNSDIKALRYGQFVTPEPAIVEGVFVANGAHISAGDAIATVRPTYRYRMQLNVADTGSLEQLVQPGSPVRVRLACAGPIGTTAAEKTAILANTKKGDVLSWLTKVKQRYLTSTDFAAQVVNVESRRATAGNTASRTMTVQLSIEIPADKRTMPIESLPNAGALGGDIGTLLTTLKFPVDANGAGPAQRKSLTLDAGPLSIGETCKTTVMAAASPQADGIALERKWTTAAAK